MNRTDWRSKLKAWTSVAASSPDMEWRGQLLASLVLVLFTLSLLVTLINLANLVFEPSPLVRLYLVKDLFTGAVLALIFVLNRRGRVAPAMWIFLTLVALVILSNPSRSSLEILLLGDVLLIVIAAFFLAKAHVYLYAALLSVGYAYYEHAIGVRMNLAATATLFALAAITQLIASRYQNIVHRAEQSEKKYRELFTDADRQKRELELLHQVSMAIGQPMQLESLFRTVVEAIAESFGYPHVSIYLLDDDKMVLQYQTGYSTITPEIPLTKGVVGRVARTGQAALVEDVHNDPDFLNVLEDTTSEVCVPLFVHGHVSGVLNLESTRGIRLSEADLELMLALGRNIGLAMERARLYAGLREGEERYRMFFENNPLPMWIYDPQTLAFLAVNDAAVEKYGYSRDELLHMNIMQIRPMDDVPVLVEHLGKHRPTLRHAGIWRHRLKDGSIINVEITSHVLEQIGGQRAILVVAQDVTERKRAEEDLHFSQLRLAALVNSAMDGIISIDSEQKIVLFNPAAERMFGYKAEEVLGKGFEMLIPAFYRAQHAQDIQNFSAAGRTSRRMGGREVIGLTKDGHEFPVDVSISQVDVGGQKLFTAILRDITERKQAERNLQRQLQELTVLNAVANAGTEAADQDELIGRVTQIISDALYPDNCGVLVLNEAEGIWRSHPSYHGTSAEKRALIHPLSEGIAGKVMRTGQIVRVGDIREEPSYTEATPGIRSEVCVPLFIAGRMFGAVNAESRQPDAFTELDVRLLATIADSLATAIQKIHLFHLEQQRTREADAIAEVGRDISQTLQLDMVFQRIATYARDLLRAETSAIYLAEPGSSNLRAAAVVGIEASEIQNDSLQIGEGILGNIALQKAGEVCNDTANDVRAVTIRGTEVFPLEHLVGVPILLKEKLTGLLAVWRSGEGQEFGAADLDFLSRLAQQAAVAIENARLFEETQQRLKEIEAVAQVSNALRQTLALEPLLENILKLAIDAISAAERGSILLADSEGNLTIRAVYGYTDPRTRGLTFAPNEGYSTKAFRAQRAMIIPDMRADRAISYEGDIPELMVEGSAITAPLIVKGQPIGVISIDAMHREAFGAGDLRLLTAIAGPAGLAIENARLFENLQRSNLELSEAYDTTLEGWARALELRDKETHGHSRRVSDLTLRLARQMGIPESEMTHIRRGVLLHDIGKMGIPDVLLRKPGPLNEEEWDEMRRHPQYAYDLLYPITYLQPALDIPYAHHERWDGTGYPQGLRREQIPLPARIFAVVDVYDALSSDRPYRPAWTREKVLDYLGQQAGRQFDPKVVEMFLKLVAE